jgi:two-component system alkaline phosphatase synthesis response regulator PhoP
MNKNFRILVVEDEEDLNEILQFNLESEGYHIDTSFSAEEALKKDLTRYHLIILDVMMGKISGFSLAQRIRKEMRLEMPIIFLTARDTENDLLTGFNLGADDYITKPFSIRELQARVKAVLKRIKVNKVEQSATSLNIGDIIIDFETKRLIIGGKKIELTRKEYEIITLLAKSPGRIFSREEILTRLRRKMEDYGSYIRNKPGFGYYFEI